MTDFTPDYLNIDYNTLVAKFKEQLAQGDIFRDYDFEGANITVLLELMAYHGDLNTYFINKIAKNVYMETADIYECVNRLARQVGYEPKGVRGSRGTLTVTVSSDICSGGNAKYQVEPWVQFNSGRSTEDGDPINFATTASLSVPCSGSSTTFGIPIRQGIVTTISNFTGKDLIDNELLLPISYAYDDDLSDDLPSIQVEINDVEWLRVGDFYTNLIPPVDDNVYMFVYDRYERNKLVFNSSRNVPAIEDVIDITVLDSLGEDGNIAADSEDDTWTIVDTNFIEFLPDTGGSEFIDNSTITLSLSGTTTGGDGPETITEIKNNSQSALRAQFRNVTENDYNSHLSSRSDVIRATAWGEQDIAPSGSIELYNLVRISVIPEVYGTSTITTSSGPLITWPTLVSPQVGTDWGKTGTVLVPSAYSPAWEQELLLYLRPRKVISHYEQFIVPDLVYFTYEIGLRIKRLATFTDVQTDVLNKLIYYFRAQNQEFASIMNFNDILEYIMDPTEVSPDSDFAQVENIRNFNMRDINSNKFIYETNQIGNYPYYLSADLDVQRDNNLRETQLGLNQFPVLSPESVSIIQET
jgi:hypothetical protein